MILEDYGKGVLCPEVIAAALEGARRKGAPVVVDPTGRDYRRYAGSTVLTPNLKEASLAAERPITDMESLESAGRLLVEQTGAAMAITREAEGISLFRRQQDRRIDRAHARAHGSRGRLRCHRRRRCRRGHPGHRPGLGNRDGRRLCHWPTSPAGPSSASSASARSRRLT